MYNPLNKVEKDLVGLREFCKEIRSRQEKIVLTSGCFDILHGGHLEYLCAAGNLGYLIVGINSDAFVKRLKGEKRPIRNEDDRAFVLAGFDVVNRVVVFDSDYDLIEAVSPDIYIASKTSHVTIWNDAKRVKILTSIGAEIVELGSGKKDSTTSIIERAAKAI